ncbi:MULTISPECIES: helix-turn-helix domain-containing protein [Streptomyces]|nr:helix-turn-helix transcriptional regulator [Streptomyces lonarensis]
MPDSTLPGDRLKRARMSRGYTQEDLANRAELSLSLIKKAERGGTLRLETYHRIARALGVRTSALLEESGPPHARRRADDQDRLDLVPLRRAIAPPETPSGRLLWQDDSAPEVQRLRTTASALNSAYHANDYGRVAELLPPLLLSAHLAVAHFSGTGEAADALRIRADLLTQAGRFLTQLRSFDLAHMALREALRDARTAGTPLLGGAATYIQGWALIREGRLDEAEALTSQAAEEIEPRISRASRDELAVWGRLWDKAAAAAARNNRPNEAREMLRLTRSAGAAVGERGGGERYATGKLTAASVLFATAEAAAVAEHPKRVLLLSERITRTGQAPTSNMLNRHLLDVAHSHMMLRERREAEGILSGLAKQAPDWLRHQQMAAETFADVLASSGRLTSRQRELAAFFDTP